MALVLPVYLSLLIGEAAAGNLGERAILKEIKLLRKILETSVCRRALGQLELEPHALIPWSSLDTCGLETLATFSRTQQNLDRPTRRARSAVASLKGNPGRPGAPISPSPAGVLVLSQLLSAFQFSAFAVG